MELREEKIVELVKDYLFHQEGNWHEDKSKIADLHQHGVDIYLVGGSKNGERFLIECKGKSYASSPKSADSANRECFLNALGQLITRMSTNRIIQSGKTKGTINNAYKYGLGLYWVGAQVALRRIPRNIATTLNLHIFAVNDEGKVIHFTPSDCGKKHPDSDFL